MKYVIVVLLLFTACQNNPPPTLSPAATLAWQKTRIIKALDVLRDLAIDAEKQTPPVISTNETRRVVQAHESILKVMNEPNWYSVAETSLSELLNNVSPETRALIGPYAALVSSLISAAEAFL